MKSLLLAVILATTPKPIITIDDGPDYRHHRRTLKLLLRHHVKATWFVNGHFLSNKRNQVLLRHIVRDGHRLGNHGWSHQYPCRQSTARFRWELRRTKLAINKTLGYRYPLQLYRPPFGQRCHFGTAKKLGYRIMMWHDGDIGRSTKQIIRTVRRRLKPSILLFHHHNWKLAAVLRVFFPVRSKSRPTN